MWDPVKEEKKYGQRAPMRKTLPEFVKVREADALHTREGRSRLESHKHNTTAVFAALVGKSRSQHSLSRIHESPVAAASLLPIFLIPPPPLPLKSFPDPTSAGPTLMLQKYPTYELYVNQDGKEGRAMSRSRQSSSGAPPPPKTAAGGGPAAAAAVVMPAAGAAESNKKKPAARPLDQKAYLAGRDVIVKIQEKLEHDVVSHRGHLKRVGFGRIAPDRRREV